MEIRRLLIIVAGSVLLTACPQKPAEPPVERTASPTPAPSDAEATPGPSATLAPIQPTPSPTPVASATPSPSVAKLPQFAGVWTVAGGKPQPFDLVVFPNGQVVTTRQVPGAKLAGGWGFWRQTESGFQVYFVDGSTAWIKPVGGGLEYFAGFQKSIPVSGGLPLQSLGGTEAPFIGTWRLNREPDGSSLFIVLASGGKAYSSAGQGVAGTWKVTPEGALCNWPDGWNDLISKTPAGFQKRTWMGSATEGANPPDITPAFRIGETRFQLGQ